MSFEIVAAPAVRRSFSIPLLPILIAAYAIIAFALVPATFLRLLTVYSRQIVLLAEILLFAVPAAGIVLRPRSPLTMIYEIIRDGALQLVAAVIAFCVGMAAFTTFKLDIPRFIPFYADKMLADADHLLFGTDPGLLLHQLIPPWAAENLDFAYGFVWYSLWFGLLGFVAMQRNADLRRHYFWAMALSFAIIGTVLAAAFSSVGPIFYDHFIPGGRFDELMRMVYAGGAGEGTSISAKYLLTALEGHGKILGSGISAMPSMHVTIVTLNAFMLTSINRYLGALGWLFVALIMVTSVYLGWHYAIDGCVALLVVSLIWWGVGVALRIRLGHERTSRLGLYRLALQANL
jgi:PAP2 superfamily protein